jgi:GNAT superfamily N-acetyltransferase
MMNRVERVHLYTLPAGLPTRLETQPGFLVEDDLVGLRGFMLIEAQPAGLALIIAAGLHDNWREKPYLALILPEVEQVARAAKLAALAYVGNAAWLGDALQPCGFKQRARIALFERAGIEPPPPAPSPARIRLAHKNDLPTIAALDKLAFDQIWHKSTASFDEALTYAASFVVATIEGKVVGYAWYEMYHRGHAHLTRLAVDPAYHGQGVGAQLLRQMLVNALAEEANIITLNTQEDNAPAHALYQQFGFTSSGQTMPMLWKDLAPALKGQGS